MDESSSSSTSIVRRTGAVLVLVVAVFILFKVVIGFVTAIAGALVFVVAIIAVIWAIRVL